MVDSTLAFNILARDRASSAFDKVARSADKTGAALAKTGKISDEVAKASARLSKSRDAETNALDKVQIAEAKLSELRSNSNAKASQVLAAEKNLAKARREAAAAGHVAQKAAKDLGAALDTEGKKAGRSAGKSVLHWFTGAGKDFEKAGKVGGEGISSGIMGALKTPIIGPAILAGAAAVVATAAPAAGAIVAGGIVAGFGAGLVGLGAVFAAKSAAVKNAWSKTLAGMGSDMTKLSKPFESTLISMAGFAQRTFARFAPELGSAFKTLAPAVTAFGDQLGRAFEQLAPAIGPLSDAFSAILRTLGPAMQSAVGKVSQGLQDLAKSVQASPGALADLVNGLGDITKASLDVIKQLNDANAAFKRLAGASSVTVIMKAIEGSIRGAGLALQAVTGPMTAVEYLLRKLGVTSDTAAPQVADLGKAATLSGGAASDMGAKVAAMNAAQGKTADGAAKAAGALSKSAHETHAANVAAALLAGAFDRQAAATQRSIDALNRRSNLLLSLSGAEIDYQQAVDDATAAIKANGRTHDLNTQKGRDNQRALDAVTASAIAQRDAMLKANDGNVKAARAAETGRAAFVKLAVQMGYSKTQAQAMAQSLIKIPNVTREAKLKANKADLDAKLAAAKRQLADKDLTKERRAQLNADIKRLVVQVNAAQAKINSLQGKTVNILTRYTTVGSRSSGAGVGGGRINPDVRASGGPVKKGLPYVVGEHRPELFVPKENGTILPKVPRSARGPYANMSTSVRLPDTLTVRLSDEDRRMQRELLTLIRAIGNRPITLDPNHVDEFMTREALRRY